MNLRDAVQEDAERLAELARRGPVDAAVAPRSLRDMIRDRTVVVAEREVDGSDGGEDRSDGDGNGGDGEGDAGDGGGDGGGGSTGDGADVAGYLSFDVQDGAVVIHHVVAETDEAREALLDRPVAFADGEGLAAVVGLAPDDPAVGAVEDRGFEVVERRAFGGDEVVRYERPAPEE